MVLWSLFRRCLSRDEFKIVSLWTKRSMCIFGASWGTKHRNGCFRMGISSLILCNQLSYWKSPCLVVLRASEHGYLVMSSICLIKYRCNRDVWYELQRLSRKKGKTLFTLYALAFDKRDSKVKCKPPHCVSIFVKAELKDVKAKRLFVPWHGFLWAEMTQSQWNIVEQSSTF